MDEAFMRAINPSVPLRDLEAAVWIVVVGIVSAHLFVMPKFFASAPRYAAVLLGISIAGFVLACFWVANRPVMFLGATLAYCVGFSVLCILAGRKASTAARRAALLACSALLLMVPLVYLLVFSAR